MTPEEQSSLLRRFEPVIRFTRGEIFYPMDVEPYIRSSSLWMQRPSEAPVLLVEQGSMNLEKLTQPRHEGFDAIYFMRFIEPLDLLKFIAYLRKKRKTRGIQAALRLGRGRLARVGYSSRFADLLFSLSLLLRGRVPGDTSAAAALEYERIQAEAESYCYHGRVLQQGGWVVLQYWLFYAFNNWRSAFFGVNDHEGDWELVNIFLSESSEGEFTPEWVAYSSHDFFGDDLRRRWDDPEIQKVGEHPLVFAGAGSHACYFAPGEYLAELEIGFLSRLSRLTNRLWAAWLKFAGQEQDPAQHPTGVNIFRVPFVDYARGDGASIGTDQEKEWDPPILLEPIPTWVSQYRGLWGLYAHDPIAGENAPAGPMYNRDGTVRRSWCDPVGWCGLDKVPPRDQALSYLRQEQADVISRQQEIEDKIQNKGAELRELSIVRVAIRDQPHMRYMEVQEAPKAALLSKELSDLRAQQASDGALLDALRTYEQRLLSGEREPARAHIHRAPRPASDAELRISRLVEFWSAVSIGLLMIGFVGLALFYRQHLFLGIIVMVSVFVFLESGFRRQLAQFVNSIAIALAVVCVLLILFDFFWTVVVLLVLFAGVYILWENLREIVG